MKDARHHLKYIQRKVLQSLRKSEQRTKLDGEKQSMRSFNLEAELLLKKKL